MIDDLVYKILDERIEYWQNKMKFNRKRFKVWNVVMVELIMIKNMLKEAKK